MEAPEQADQLIPLRGQDPSALALLGAIRLWADSSTVPDSTRRKDLIRDKTRAVASFFAFTGKHPAEVLPGNVRAWQAELEGKGLRNNTVYVRICFLSSFYAWAMRDVNLGAQINANPVVLARPRAPKAYQTESVKSLTDEELGRLLSVVYRKAINGELVGKRDYAILLLLLATGMRRAEVISLRGSDLKLGPTLVLNNRVKGGHYVGREVSDTSVAEALLDYLTTAGRLHVLKTDAPVWTRHDRAGSPGEPLSSHSFAINMKRYAREAGIGDFHLHQTRHTFARIVSELTGSITDTQNALDHKNPSTTRVYVQRIAVKRDLYSKDILSRWSEKKDASE
jgi:integrase